MNEKSTNDDERYGILSIFIIAGAAIWPFIYPVLDYVLAFLGFAKSPGIVEAIMEFGPSYGQSETAPGIFKAMAEIAQQVSGEHPAIASLSYMEKVNLLFYLNLPVYAAEFLIFVLVVAIALLSRILPSKLAGSVLQRIAIAVSMLPLLAISLLCIAFFLLAFYQAWHVGILDFIFLFLLWPVVATKVVSSHVGVFLLGYGFVPVGLSFAGRGSLAREYLSKFLDVFLDLIGA